MRSFGSDNHSGVHPAVLTALIAANADHCVAYGEDRWTSAAKAELQRVFGAQSTSFFVFNGTAANVLALAPFLQSIHSVICSSVSHLDRDECGAPESLIGAKLITVNSPDGKLTPELVTPLLDRSGEVHAVQPKVISITQPNEFGLFYSVAEVAALSKFAKAHGLILHMDGSRISNACASLGIGLYDLSGKAGVDVLSFGGTKNGLMFGECVVFFSSDGDVAHYYQKQFCQLASKMRFVSAQFEAYLKNDLWLKNAQHANQMAKLLGNKMSSVPELRISRNIETNMVFAELDPKLAERLQKDFFFYRISEKPCEVRWVCSFDTTEEDIDCLVRAAMSQS